MNATLMEIVPLECSIPTRILTFFERCQTITDHRPVFSERTLSNSLKYSDLEIDGNSKEDEGNGSVSKH